jgi:hypothetical protein
MNYNSLSDHELQNIHEKIVNEKLRLEDELWDLGVTSEILDTVKQKIFDLSEKERNVEHIAELLRKRQGLDY